ncbi:MAG: class I fructose-bisphosphate aldolase [Candidatus Geothermincolia bacterium]
MSTGKQLRLSRIFGEDKRSLIVALDHAAIAGPMGPLAEPGQLVSRIMEGSPDALLLTRGMLRQCASHLKPDTGVILRISGGWTVLSGLRSRDRIVSSVEEGLRWGADGVAVTIKYGSDEEGPAIEAASRVADACDRWGMPLLIETLPEQRSGVDFSESEALAIAARSAAELGADMVKTAAPKDGGGLAAITAGCPVPVLILGGEAKGRQEVLESARHAMQMGASALCMGRSIWMAPDPAAMVASLRELIHS